MGDENGTGANEMETLAMKLNEEKLMDRLSSASSRPSTSSISSTLTNVSLASLLAEDGGDSGCFWSPSLSSIQKQTTEEDLSPLLRSQSGGLSSDTEMVKERFSRLLLGEDMSGSGQGVSTALAISNAITNLYASIFGQLWRLEPLSTEKKESWRREMDLLLSVSDHIVEMVPSYKTFQNGKMEVMTTKQRSDLSINLPALRKLDSMLLELLDEFNDTEFWYVDQGKVDEVANISELSAKASESLNGKWWLPVPQVPDCGLSLDSKTQLQRKRECAIQILRATILINTDTISEMEVPHSYLKTLPKNSKSSLGDHLYKFITSDNFSVERVLECLDLSADHIVLKLVNRLEAAIYLWHTRSQSRLIPGSSYSPARSSVAEADRRELFSTRAGDLILTLKHQFPHLPHSTLEAYKIQYNKDVGKSILESYSRVLETLAYNIASRIDNVLSIATQDSPMTPSHYPVSDISPLPLSRNPSRNATLQPQTPLHNSYKLNTFPSLNKQPRRSSLTRRVLNNYLCTDARSKSGRRSAYDSVLSVSNPRIDTLLPPSSTPRRQLSHERSCPKI